MKTSFIKAKGSDFCAHPGIYNAPKVKGGTAKNGGHSNLYLLSNIR